MKNNYFSNLSDLFPQIATKHKVKPQLDACHACYVCTGILKEMFSTKEKNNFAKATALKNKCIIITVASSMQAQQIALKKMDILERLHEKGFDIQSMRTTLV